MITCLFTVTVQGNGESVEDAWVDAMESLSEDIGPCPEEGEYEVIDHVTDE